MILKVTINGTERNPWHRWNLRQNPFPQFPKSELDQAMMQLNSLDGDPIEDPEAEIRERLQGWSEEFIQLCINNFEHGKRVRFRVSVPEEAVNCSASTQR